MAVCSRVVVWAERPFFRRQVGGEQAQGAGKGGQRITQIMHDHARQIGAALRQLPLLSDISEEHQPAQRLLLRPSTGPSARR
ncbi:MAG: hypothetical protein M5U34_00425 [Chloroflexi bacterium]|nr:hypothetical protein [Chloroflexota bacterium]